MTEQGFQQLVDGGQIIFGVGVVDRVGRGELIAAGPFLDFAWGPLGSHCGVVQERLFAGLVSLQPSTEEILSSRRDPTLRDEFGSYMARRSSIPQRTLSEWTRVQGIAHILLGELRAAAGHRADDAAAETLVAATIRVLSSAPPGTARHEAGELFAQKVEVQVPLLDQIEYLKHEYDQVASRLMVDEAIALYWAILQAQAESGDPVAIGRLTHPEAAAELAELTLDDPIRGLAGFVELMHQSGRW